MYFDLNLEIPTFRDIFPYAGETILLFGVLFLLLHFTFLSTTQKYSTLIEYSTRTSIYILSLVQVFNVYNLNLFSTEMVTKLYFNGALILNNEIIFLKIILTFLAILILLVSETYFKNTKMGYFEYNILFLLSFLGCLITLSVNDLMGFYISLEIQALAFYIMATLKKSPISSEAGLKYFIVGSFSSALLLFGISLIVLLTGHFNFNNIALFLSINFDNFQFFLFLGAFLIITSLLIKLAVAPFHEWVADIYEGIMTPTALFFATIPKISNFFILTRLTENVFNNFFEVLQPYLILVCILSLILGSLNAFKQQNIKRFLAYSSVNHFGFILIGLILKTKVGIEASFFYLTFYIILTFGLWTSLILLTYTKNMRIYNLTRITELGGLIYSHPGLAFSFLIMLLSTGAIPPLAGFNAKISVFYALIDKAYTESLFTVVLIIAMLSSILSVYYYIRVIKILTFVSKTQSFKNSVLFNTTNTLGNNTQTLSTITGNYILAFITVFNIFAFLLFL
jgi:NADH-quinone oxidoreductase subunit N